MSKNFAIFFSYFLVIFVGYFVATALYLNILHFLNMEHSNILYFLCIVCSSFIALKYKNKIIEQFRWGRK